jgi:hypothetical protein
MTVIDIIVAPEPRNPGSLHRRARFIASLAASGRVLGSFSSPLCGVARVLLSEHVSPDTVLQMRHTGSDAIALRSTVGAAAGLTVSEEASTGAPQFVKWKDWANREAAE